MTVLHEIAAEQGDRLKIVTLDVDHQQQVAGQLGVLSIPALFLYKNGQVVKQLVGARPKAALLREIEPYLI